MGNAYDYAFMDCDPVFKKRIIERFGSIDNYVKWLLRTVFKK